MSTSSTLALPRVVWSDSAKMCLTVSAAAVGVACVGAVLAVTSSSSLPVTGYVAVAVLYLAMGLGELRWQRRPSPLTEAVSESGAELTAANAEKLGLALEPANS